MALSYYRDLLQLAVCDMACCSGPFGKRLQQAWVNYIYKIRWHDLEALLLEEDQPTFREFKRRLHTDILNDISKRTDQIIEETKSAPRPLTGELISKYANAEGIIRAMSGARAKSAVKAIVEMYKAVDSTVEFRVAAQGRIS